MLIFVACYQFSFLFTLTPKLQICCLHGPIYPQCYSWGQLCTGSSQGDVFWEQPGSEWRIYPSRKPKHYRLQGGVLFGHGVLLGSLHWRSAKARHGGGVGDLEEIGGWKKRRKWEATLELPSVYPLSFPPAAHSVSATQPIIFPDRRKYLSISSSHFMRVGEIRIDPKQSFIFSAQQKPDYIQHSFCSLTGGQWPFLTNIFLSQKMFD